MGVITGTLAWIYDFLAEDPVLLVGTVIAVLIAVAAVHAVHNAAGGVLFVGIVVVIAASLWRTVSASKA